MIFPYSCLKNIGYKFEPYVCNKCEDLSIIAFEFCNTECKRCWL